MVFYFIDCQTFKCLRYGLFAVNKTSGITSAKTLEVIKSKLAEGVVQESASNPYLLRAGHGGTLDSSATGVLVVGLLEGCKLLTQHLQGSKEYRVTGKLGTATDTYNHLGIETHSAPYQHVTETRLRNVLKKYLGKIKQVPPKYSALKRSGVRLSDLVRSGHEVKVAARDVECLRLQLIEFSPPYFHLSLACGSGFYVRSLVNDIGNDVGSCAHVSELVRTRQGVFCLEDSLSPQHWTKHHIIEAITRTRPSNCIPTTQSITMSNQRGCDNIRLML